MSQKTDLKTLSKTLGLSQTTVSRALNGFPEVAENTRARVVEAARQMNYRPSHSAAGLATGRSMAIGHVLPTSDHVMINPIFTDFLAGACDAYARAGYDLLTRVVDESLQEDVYRELASQGRVDGVVVHGPLVDDSRIPLLIELGIPFIVHGRSDQADADFAWLDVDNKRAFERATQLLLDLGHRRIALLNGIETMNFAKRRREGFQASMKRSGISVDPSLLHSADMTEPYGYQKTLEMMRSGEPPTAILTASVLCAMGISRALGELGLKMGQDISVVTFDDDLSFLRGSNRNQEGYFTCVRSSIQNAGQRIGELLIERINNPNAEFAQELWEAELIVGHTTGPCRSR